MTAAVPMPTRRVRATIDLRRARSSARARVSTAVMGPTPQPWGEPTARPMAVRTVEAGLVRRGLPPGFFGKMPLIPTVVRARAVFALLRRYQMATEYGSRLIPLAASQHGVLSRAQALSYGVSNGTIARRLKSGDWIADYPGV